jgi:hypothetical protein
VKHLLLIALALSSAAPAAPDRTCAEVAAFHMAKFDSAVEPKGRRWVELHWIGGWLDFDHGWGFRCRHSPDAASSQLCNWLVHHTSYEFSQSSPKRILSCFGYRFPRMSMWGEWKSDIDILDHQRWLKLEIDFATLKGETGAIRLSSFAKDRDDALVEMPSLGPLEDKQ